MQRLFLSFSLISCFLSLPLFAQDRAAINGVVTDASGAIVPNAGVELVLAATGLRRATVGSPKGLYEFTPLPVGSYTLTIIKEGFRPTTIRNIDVQYGETRTVDARLEVGGISDSVTVTATAEAPNRTNAEVSGIIESAQIKEIPVSGRNWASLMLLTPGAINYGDGAQRAIRFSGHSLDDSNFTFDGVDASGVQEQTQKSDTRLNIALDAIQEFRVSTSNYTAESGAAGGAQINVVSKAGTNQFHGGTLYALRSDKLDSRSPFDGPTLPPFSLHQFGASFGGPVVKDKAFFYLNYEGLRQSLGETFTNFVPNTAFRAQVLAKSPGLKPILDAYPLGQRPVNSVTGEVTKVATHTVRENAGMARFDYRFNDKNTAYFRYNVDNAYIDNPIDALGGHNVIPHIPTNIVVQYQRTISSTLVNQAKIGMNRANYHNWGYGTSPVAADIPGFDSVSDTSLDTEVGTTSVQKARRITIPIRKTSDRVSASHGHRRLSMATPRSGPVSVSITAATRTTISAIRPKARCPVITSRQMISRTWRIRWLPFSIPGISSSVPRQSTAIARTFITRTGTSSSSSSCRTTGSFKSATRGARDTTFSIAILLTGSIR